MELVFEKKGVWTDGGTNNAQCNVHVVGRHRSKGDYYNLVCSPTAQGWLVDVMMNGVHKGAYQGSTFNMYIEMVAAIGRVC